MYAERKAMTFRLVFMVAATALTLAADVVVLRDGSSYTGQLHTGTGGGGPIAFTGDNGVGFTFPIRDIQSLAFTANADTVTLRSGKSYSGHYNGQAALHLTGADSISYDFPIKDIASIVFSEVPHRNGSTGAKANTGAKIIPEGTEISITTNEGINSEKAKGGELYSATIASDTRDSRGEIAIPSGTPAKLVVRDISGGGAVHTPELVLDLYSVDVNGKTYRTITSNVVEKGRETVGLNKRTAIYAGGGGGLGALLGGIFGGGEGAGIGAAAGAGAGALTQLFTRGKRIKVPAETTMTFRLDRTLVLRP
jgi:outer membrane lipoprotein SlyB